MTANTQPGNTMNRSSWQQRLRTLSLAALVGYWVVLVVVTHIPTVPQPLASSDKYQHFVAYGGLALLIAWAWSLRAPFGWKQALLVLALVGLQGAFDEVTQPLFGRHADVTDWRADMIGAVVAVVVFSAVRALVRGRLNARG
jgi:VanZ family protein